MKHLAEIVLRYLGPVGVARRLRGQRDLILAYHNVIPSGRAPVGDLSLHIPQRVFGRHLDVLMESGIEVVPLQQLVEEPACSRALRVAITFDDAYRGAMTIAVAELRRRGLPATVFVSPRLVDGGAFWWDELAVWFRCRGSDPEATQRELIQLKGDYDRIRSWAESAGGKPSELPDFAHCASEQELSAVVRISGMTLASHGWSHRNLAALDAEELSEELVLPLSWLRSRFDSVLPYLAFPYGSRSAEVDNRAAECGYSATFRVEGGFMPHRAGVRYSLPRRNVPAGLSDNGLALRLSGLVGRK